MLYILYNPLSSGGKCQKKVDKIAKDLKREYRLVDLLNIKNHQEFITNLKKDDEILIVGGDGTLNKLINQVDIKTIPNNIYLAKAGTGNDFYRDINNDEDFIKINDYLTKTSTCYFNNHEYKYLNSAGIGLDGDICHLVNSSKRKKNHLNYYFNCLKALLGYKKYTLEVEYDNNKKTYQNVYFAAVMNGRYFGGGMMIAPNQKRNFSNLSLVIVHNVNIFKLLLILPKVYSGKHVKYQKYVEIIETNSFILNTSLNKNLEIDGEVFPNINKISVKKGD